MQGSTCPRLRILALAGTLAGVAASAGAPAARAETELGDDLIASGEIEAGGRVISGDFDSAKFEEYRSIRPGGFSEGWFLVEDLDRIHYLRGDWSFQDEDDQTYRLGLGRYGFYGLDLEYQQFPHDYANRSLTPYGKSFGVGNFLPPSWDFTAAGADLGAELDANLRKQKLGFRQINGSVEGYVRPQLGLQFSAGYEIQNKRGNDPYAITFGFGAYDNYASPRDEDIHNVTAEATWAQETWTLGLGYLGSFYDNQKKWDVVQNPLVAPGDDAIGSPSSGRNSVAPDNSAHQASLSGSLLLPTSFPARLAGTFSYGVRLQDDHFIPITINPVLAPVAPPTDALDGRVYTALANLSFTARPTPDVNVEARYRLYDFDNDSNEISFTDRVAYDNAVSAGARSHANQYTRQNAELETSWRVAQPVTLIAGFDWESWDRSKDREARHVNEYGGELGAIYRPRPRVQVMTTWRVDWREYNKYVTLDPVELPQLRKYDLANRLRHSVDWKATWIATDELTLGLSAGAAWSDYPDSAFGLRDELRWNLGTDFEYAPLAWLRMSGWYAYDDIFTKQKSMRRTSTADLPSTTPDQIWRSNTRDWAHTAGADLFVEVVPGLLDWETGFVLQIASADTHTSGNANAGTAVDWPDIQDQLYTVETSLTWHVLEQIDLIAGYGYQEFHSDDFHYNGIGTNQGGNDVYLNDKVKDYAAHIVHLSARLEF